MYIRLLMLNIQYGFADNVEEELLEFNEKGELVKCTKGAKDKRRDAHLSGVGAGQHMLDEMEQMSLRSGSTSRPGGKSSKKRDKSAYSQSATGNPDYEEDDEDDLDDDDDLVDDEKFRSRMSPKLANGSPPKNSSIKLPPKNG